MIVAPNAGIPLATTRFWGTECLPTDRLLGIDAVSTTGSLAQPPKTKEPYGCDIPLAGAYPTVCQLQVSGIGRAGVVCVGKKKDGTLLLYVSAINAPYRLLYHVNLPVWPNNGRQERRQPPTRG